jgi:predicted dehydrogenase
MSQTVKWGLIGASGWADHTFAPAIRSAGNAELSAVLSSSAERSADFCTRHHVSKGYTNFEAFLEDTEFQAVYIASPSYLHADQVVAALRAGKHVLCEKPMALNVSECKSMIEVAEQSAKLLSIGYMMRYHPMHRKIQADWKTGKFGKPVSVRSQFYFSYPGVPPTWRQKRETSGGWAINDIGTHLIDLLLWFLGDATDIYGSLSSTTFDFETDDQALVIFRSTSGCIGVAEASTGAVGPAPRLELYGSEGYCILEGTFLGQGGTVTQSIGSKLEIFDALPINLYQAQVEAFGRSILSGEPLINTAEDGIKNIQILSKARGY